MHLPLTLSSTLKTLTALALAISLSMIAMHGVQGARTSDGAPVVTAAKSTQNGGPPGSWAS